MNLNNLYHRLQQLDFLIYSLNGVVVPQKLDSLLCVAKKTVYATRDVEFNSYLAEFVTDQSEFLANDKIFMAVKKEGLTKYVLMMYCDVNIMEGISQLLSETDIDLVMEQAQMIEKEFGEIDIVVFIYKLFKLLSNESTNS